MSFQKTAQPSAGQKKDNGHWALRYFGEHGVLRRDRRAFKGMKKWFFGLHVIPNAYTLNYVQEKFVRTGLTYASTLYSARFIPGIQIVLAKVVDEIEPHFREVGLTASEKEVMMAIYEHLTNFSRLVFGDKEKYKGKAFVLGEEIFREYDKGTVLWSTFLLANARMSRLPQVSESTRAYDKRYVQAECKILMAQPENLHKNLPQGWKTIARLGGIIEDWPMVETALSHDSSRAIHVKSWMCPGYMWYKTKKIFS